jgi:MFS transporter, DHA2 family, multidrug resistance protein
VNSFFEQAQSHLLQLTGDPAAARQMALQLLENLRQQQSSALAHFDTFFVFAVLSVPLVAVVFMMRRSVAQKGGHTFLLGGGPLPLLLRDARSTLP